ncbi:MAG TPA: phage integrase SAM-like domain-containing protein [Thermogutta sp.]|nr:phage integrase SAM-like domain-containing protein [Thermogutta sp.]
MASLSKHGHTFRLYVCLPDGRRVTLYLGKLPRRQAESFKVHVEQLAASMATATAIPDPTAVWLAALPDGLYEKLERCQLAPARVRETLGRLIERYEREYVAGLALRSQSRIKNTTKLLSGYFGPKARLSAITQEDAERWRTWLAEGRTEATVRLHVRNAKGLFNWAMTHRLADNNPFQTLVGASMARNDERYVSLEDFERLLDACPNHGWRVLLGLARLAGLRSPSETDSITWADIN